MKRKLGASPHQSDRFAFAHERRRYGGSLVVRPNPPAMVDDRRPRLEGSSGEGQSAHHNCGGPAGSFNFLLFQRHFNAMVRRPQRHQNTHTCGEIISAATAPHRSSVATSPPLGALVLSRVEWMLCNESRTQSKRHGPHSASRASVDRCRSDEARRDSRTACGPLSA